MNTMGETLKISEIINFLDSIKNEHGDIKMGTWADGILRFIRSVKYIENEDHSNSAAVLLWWQENEEAE